jgi:hypothetical protein
MTVRTNGMARKGGMLHTELVLNAVFQKRKADVPFHFLFFRMKMVTT